MTAKAAINGEAVAADMQPRRLGWRGWLILVALYPLILVVGWTLAGWAMLWRRFLYKPRPYSALDLVKGLNVVLGDFTDVEVDWALKDIGVSASDDPKLAALRQRVLNIGPAPFDAAAIDELKAIRDSARTIAAGDAS